MFLSKEYDEKMGIQTRGIIEWKRQVNREYTRCEPTPYGMLEAFFQRHDFLPKAQVVDFGSGKGRVAFYLNYFYDLPVTAIELNRQVFDYLIDNRLSYYEKFPEREGQITLLNDYAEKYKIKDQDNTFYFFNPFTVKIFEPILKQIMDSYRKNPRPMELILYYPLPPVVNHILKETPFDFFDSVDNPDREGASEYIAVFRLEE